MRILFLEARVCLHAKASGENCTIDFETECLILKMNTYDNMKRFV